MPTFDLTRSKKWRKCANDMTSDPPLFHPCRPDGELPISPITLVISSFHTSAASISWSRPDFTCATAPRCLQRRFFRIGDAISLLSYLGRRRNKRGNGGDVATDRGREREEGGRERAIAMPPFPANGRMAAHSPLVLLVRSVTRCPVAALAGEMDRQT